MNRRHPRGARAALALVLAATACTVGWHREPIGTLAEPSGPRRDVEVWIGTSAQRLRVNRIAGDTLFAAPYFSALDCTECEVRIRMSSIDSIRVKQYNRLTEEQSRSVFITTGIALTLGLALLLAIGAAWAGAYGGFQ